MYDEQLELLCSLTRMLLQCEAKFVSDYNCSELDGDFKDSDEDIDRFNTEVLTILRKLARVSTFDLVKRLKPLR